MNVDEVVTELHSRLVTPGVAKLKPSEGGVPAIRGLYAWWAHDDALPGVPLTYVSNLDAWLLYIGVAPSRAGSGQTLRGRICGNHLRGNVAASTFRLSLASLLWQQEGWTLARRGSKALLSPVANEALSTWQRENLRVSWAAHSSPWEVEPHVIKAMSPPLNLASNRSHIYSWTLSEARQRFRSAALSVGS